MVEFVTLFNSLGSNVTLIQRSLIYCLLQKRNGYYPEKHLIRKGINIITDTKLKSTTEDGVLTDHKGEENYLKGTIPYISRLRPHQRE